MDNPTGLSSHGQQVFDELKGDVAALLRAVDGTALASARDAIAKEAAAVALAAVAPVAQTEIDQLQRTVAELNARLAARETASAAAVSGPDGADTAASSGAAGWSGL